MKKFIMIFALLFGFQAEAAVHVEYQDLKLPSQQMIEKQDFGTPVVASTNNVKSAFAGNTSSAAVTLTTFAAQPDVPRNLVITPGTSTVDVGTCTVTVNGTNIKGTGISEDFAFTNNQSSATTGSKAFKTVTSVVFPLNCEDGSFAATWSIGVGEKIGLKRCMTSTGDWFHSTLNGTKEATAATIAVSATAVESNTADFNGTMDGSADFIGYFMQNYRCL